jgi:hypothetical protein
LSTSITGSPVISPKRLARVDLPDAPRPTMTTRFIVSSLCRLQFGTGVSTRRFCVWASWLLPPDRHRVLCTLPAIDNDLYPHAGRPGFNAAGERVSQADVDTADDATPTEDPAKSQKPN